MPVDQPASLYNRQYGLTQGLWRALSTAVIVREVTSVNLTHLDYHVTIMIRRLITTCVFDKLYHKTICPQCTIGTNDYLSIWSVLAQRTVGA